MVTHEPEMRGGVLPIDVGRARGEDLPQHRRVLAHPPDRVVQRVAVPALDGDLVARADAEGEPPAARLVERRRLLRHERGVAQEDRDDAGAEADPLGVVRVVVEELQRLARRDVRHPHALVAERLRQPHALDAFVQRAARRPTIGVAGFVH